MTRSHEVAFGTIGDTSLKFLNTKYVSPTDPLTMDQMVEKKNHNTMMIGIASALNYAKFDEFKGCHTSHQMWNKLQNIYRGDKNVRRAKEKSLRGQFDQMKMREDENITKYVERIKASVSTIKAYGRDILLCPNLGH